jgi:uncharacterized protein YndB with AHSA1/START domain
MPPVLDSLAPTGFTIDERTHTIGFERRFAAGRDQVFAAWTEPRHVSSWWDPTGEPLARCEIDLRVGGCFTFVNRAHPAMPFSGVYREIAPPERLVFEAMGAEGRVTLAEGEGRTLMTVEIACDSAEHLEQFVKMGVAAGTSQTLDNLVAYLGGEAN